jgi:hypothetical protein
MIIYCNGDSFTAGTELGDDILPNYPGTLNFMPTVEQRELANKWKDSTHDPLILGSIRHENRLLIKKLELERAWPNKLSSLGNIEVINGSEGGASMDRIARTTICDLLRLKKNTEDIIVIIGTTSTIRFELGNRNFWQTILVTSHVNKEIEPIVRFKLEMETDYHWFVNFFKNVIYIKEFCKTNGFKLYFLNACTILPTYDLLDKNKDLQDMVNYADLKYELNMKDIAEKINYNVRTTTFHYSEIVHDEVAKILYEKLIK